MHYCCPRIPKQANRLTIATMSTMDGVDVVVAGLPGVGKATLMKGLGATQRSQESNLHDLRLTTKYYTADLVVRCDKGLHKSAAPPTPALGGGDQQQRQVQALLLVVDASSENSLKHVLRYHKLLRGREFEIQLLVANKMDTVQHSGSGSGTPAGISSPAWLQEARTWCYSNGFEYIEAAAGNAAVDAALQDEDGEQQGLARVLAALQANMWPNHHHQQQQQQQQEQQVPQHTANPAAASSSSSNPEVASSSSAHSNQHDQGSGQAQLQDAPHASTSSGGAMPAPSAAAASQADTTAGAGSKPGQVSNREQQQQEQQQEQQQQGPDEEEEDPFLGADVDNFEQLMRQVMGARARLSRLPDAERRAAAADLALKLSMMMGVGDSEGSESGDEGAAAAAAAGDDRQPQPDANRRRGTAGN